VEEANKILPYRSAAARLPENWRSVFANMIPPLWRWRGRKLDFVLLAILLLVLLAITNLLLQPVYEASDIQRAESIQRLRDKRFWELAYELIRKPGSPASVGQLETINTLGPPDRALFYPNGPSFFAYYFDASARLDEVLIVSFAPNKRATSVGVNGASVNNLSKWPPMIHMGSTQPAATTNPPSNQRTQ
jgi:hypothetical protein